MRVKTFLFTVLHTDQDGIFLFPETPSENKIQEHETKVKMQEHSTKEP
jgi:hypothetical protein